MSGRLRRFASWFVLLASVGWVLHFFVTNPEEFGLLLSLHPVALGLLLALQVVFLLLHAQRYRIVLEKCSERSVAFAPWFRLFVVGRFFNAVMPQLGSAYRGFRLKELFGITWTRYFGALFAFAWMSTGFNLVFALAVVLAIEPALTVSGIPGAAVLLAGFVLVAAGPFAALAVLRARMWHINRLVWLQERILEALSIVLGNLRDGPHMAKNSLLALAAAVHGSLMFALLFWSLGLPTNASDIVIFYTVLHLSSVVMLTPGNLGVREVLFGILGESMGVGMAEGLLVSALLRVTDYAMMTLLAMTVGGVSVLRQVSQYRAGWR